MGSGAADDVARLTKGVTAMQLFGCHPALHPFLLDEMRAALADSAASGEEARERAAALEAQWVVEMERLKEAQAAAAGGGRGGKGKGKGKHKKLKLDSWAQVAHTGSISQSAYLQTRVALCRHPQGTITVGSNQISLL